MEKERKMIVNCNICDTRKLQKETCGKYDSIIINAGLMIVSPRSKLLLDEFNITGNISDVIEIEEDKDFDIPIVSYNGNYNITASVPSENDIVLSVNGNVTISPGAEEALRHYKKISINGNIMCPESIVPHLPPSSVNGKVITHPDDYTCLKGKFEIDKYFPIRAAKDGKYFVRDMVRLIDNTVDITPLIEKNVHFKTGKLLVAEEMLAGCIPLFDEDVNFIVVPAGMSAIDGGAKLNSDLIKKYGDKIFIYGNLDATGDFEEVIPQIEKLVVTGKVTVLKKTKELFDKINAEYDRIETVKSMRVGNKGMVKLDNNMLKLSDDGVSVRGCGIVTIADEVKPQDIIDCVDISGVGIVRCSEEQRSAVEMVCHGVGKISTDDLWLAKDSIKSLLGMVGSKIINSETYVM